MLSQNVLQSTDFELLKRLGLKSIRIPVDFECFESERISVEQIFPLIDNIVKKCSLYL